MKLEAKNRLLASQSPNAGNVDTTYKVGSVVFDNVNGMGSTPDGQNVEYKGLVIVIKPSVFRSLAAAADRSEDAAKFVKLIREGKTVAAPFLSLRPILKGDELIALKVVNHEGRARADAVKELIGDVPIPIQLFCSGKYDRARYIDTEFLDVLTNDGLIPQDSEYTSRQFTIKEIFLNGESV
jgi:hypothetical protein